MKKNLVLGILDNYNFHQVKKFVYSLQQSGFDGDLCFFIGPNTSRSTISAMRKAGIILQFFPGLNVLPKDNLAAQEYKLPQPINYFNYRHYLYYDFLLRNREIYKQVLLTDVRDVYFQRDPFDFEHGEGLYCALEGKEHTIADCSYNGPWMEFIYGKEMLGQLGHNIISCAGTTWGSTESIISYLRKMLKEIQHLQDAKKAIDQAIHNYLIYTNRLPEAKLVGNDEGIVLTLSYEKNYSVTTDNKVLAANGRLVNVLHQFDRMPDLKELTDKLFLTNSFRNYWIHQWYEANRLKKRSDEKIKNKNFGLT